MERRTAPVENAVRAAPSPAPPRRDEEISSDIASNTEAVDHWAGQAVKCFDAFFGGGS